MEFTTFEQSKVAVLTDRKTPEMESAGFHLDRYGYMNKVTASGYLLISKDELIGNARWWIANASPEAWKVYHNDFVSKCPWIDIGLKFPNIPDKDCREVLKENGFTWNRFEEIWHAPKTNDQLKFVESLKVDTPSPSTPTSSEFAPRNLDRAEKLKALANGMEKAVRDKLNPAIGQQRPTRRRERIASGMREEGYKLEKIQELFYSLANAHELGNCPWVLSKIVNKAQVESLMAYAGFPMFNNGLGWDKLGTDTTERLEKIGINQSNFDEAHKLLLGLGKATPKKQLTQEEIRKLEAELIGAKIPGYFPTPKKVIEFMLSFLKLKRGMRVLEPSAGKGNIVDALLELDLDLDITAIELNHTLSKILSKKMELRGEKVLVMQENFPALAGGGFKQFDAIIMNPPWGKDCGEHAGEHIIHAYNYFLKPGGRLVSVCDEGCFFRNFTKDHGFREWLTARNAQDLKLDPGSFLESEVSTGVNCRIVVVDKPGEPPNPEVSSVSASQSFQELFFADPFSPKERAIAVSVVSKLNDLLSALDKDF